LKGYPATVRFLDPPLHEFLPNSKEAHMDLARKLNVPVEKIQHRVHELHEFNPMLGFRGCRLGIKYPERVPHLKSLKHVLLSPPLWRRKRSPLPR
jgi:pyruvate,orthophosphate dikinase